MFFNVRGIKWTVAAILAVIALCALDLHCSNKADDDRAEEPSGSIARVLGEIEVGKREYASLRADQLEEQLRSLRALAKKLTREGRTKEARSAISAIMEIEEQAKRLRERSENDGKNQKPSR